MSNQMKHAGPTPDTIFVVSTDDMFWVYIKEGHALNRLLKERKAGRDAHMSKYCQADCSERSSK